MVRKAIYFAHWNNYDYKDGIDLCWCLIQVSIKGAGLKMEGTENGGQESHSFSSYQTGQVCNLIPLAVKPQIGARR